MAIFLLILCTVSASSQDFFAKLYSDKTDRGVFLFNALTAAASIIVFLISSKCQLTFDGETVIYALLFAVSFVMAVVGATWAVRYGPVSLTALIVAFSLVVPAVYGFVFCDEPISGFMSVGLGLLAVSLVLVNLVPQKKEEKKTAKFHYGRWAVFAAVAFVGNGAASTVQKIQQDHCGEDFRDEFMILALALAFVGMMICFFLFEDFRDFGTVMKKGGLPALGRGLCNGVANLTSLILIEMLPISLVYPIISAGGAVWAAGMSVLLFRERLTKAQWLGVGIGVVSLVFLNL